MNHIITLKDAAAMTKRFRSQIKELIIPEHAGQNVIANSETFDAASVQKLLNQSGCVKLRVYYGMSETLNVHAILVGVNLRDEDMLPFAETNVPGNDGDILEEAFRCPPSCPPASRLNTD